MLILFVTIVIVGVVNIVVVILVASFIVDRIEELDRRLIEHSNKP